MFKPQRHSCKWTPGGVIRKNVHNNIVYKRTKPNKNTLEFTSTLIKIWTCKLFYIHTTELYINMIAAHQQDESEKHYRETKDTNHRRVCKRIQFIKVQNKQNYI